MGNTFLICSEGTTEYLEERTESFALLLDSCNHLNVSIMPGFPEMNVYTLAIV